jgi:prepilin-type N-terminal cleavage/methylation domain-containing protein
MNKIFFKPNKGFTLLEMTATLIVVSMISFLAGKHCLFLIDLYKVYHTNFETAQKARFVINRLVNEFIHITTIHNASEKKIHFKSRFNNQESMLIEFKNNSLEIDHFLFADNIFDFKLRYLDSATAFDNTSYDIWKDQLSNKSTAIQFDIAFFTGQSIESPTNIFYFNNITAVPRSLKESD